MPPDHGGKGGGIRKQLGGRAAPGAPRPDASSSLCETYSVKEVQVTDTQRPDSCYKPASVLCLASCITLY